MVMLGVANEVKGQVREPGPGRGHRGGKVSRQVRDHGHN